VFWMLLPTYSGVFLSSPYVTSAVSFVAILATIITYFYFFRWGLELMGSDQLLLHFRLISTHEIPDRSSSCCCCCRSICNYTKNNTDT
jgi:hypothetical protein